MITDIEENSLETEAINNLNLKDKELFISDRLFKECSSFEEFSIKRTLIGYTHRFKILDPFWWIRNFSPPKFSGNLFSFKPCFITLVSAFVIITISLLSALEVFNEVNNPICYFILKGCVIKICCLLDLIMVSGLIIAFYYHMKIDNIEYKIRNIKSELREKKIKEKMNEQILSLYKSIFYNV